MKRIVIVMLLTTLLLTGCSRETQVWLPEEEVVELQGKDVVRIPMGEETVPAETEPAQPTAEESEPAPTQPAQTEKASITKKTTTTAKKNTSKDTTTNKDTVSATEKPVSTKPTATEPPATEVTVTEPPVTEAPATEPAVTEPAVTEPPLYDISNYQMGNLEYEMLDRINEHRAEASLDSVWMDTRLSAIASCRSYEVSLVWSHTRPDGRHFATVLTDYDYSAGAVQELLVYDSGSGDGVAIVDRWMESKAQRELLLSDYTTAGIGVYRADGLVYVTCLLVR